MRCAVVVLALVLMAPAADAGITVRHGPSPAIVGAAAYYAGGYGYRPYYGPVYVRPYVRRDGSYVPGHYRSRPDGYRYNNWSMYPKVNPYYNPNARYYRNPSVPMFWIPTRAWGY